MKRRIRIPALLLALAILLTALPLGASAAELPFTDVPANAWYREAVEYAYENSLFQGNSATEFAPNAPMTRAMFVQVLANKAENYNKADWAGRSSFSDVKKDQWYAAAIEWASKAGLVSGVGGGNFAPEQNVTREQMATILYNYAKKTGNDTSFDAKVLDAFPDASTVSSYAREAVQWAVTHQVINGSDGKLTPKSNAKRCEVAQVAVNAEPVLVENNVEIPDQPEPSPDPTPTPTPNPADPTPDDLPEGALTYQEFVDMFPNRKTVSPHNQCMYVNGISMDVEKMKALDATGTTILRKYAITQIGTMLDFYEGWEQRDVILLTYSLWNDGTWDQMQLWYHPNDPNAPHMFFKDVFNY